MTAVVALSVLPGCTGGGGSDAPAGSGASTSTDAERTRLEPACEHETRHRKASADLVNQIVASADLPTWQAADIGASAQLSDGRLVWVFGDTVRAASLSPRIVANSMLVSDGPCVSQVLPPGDGPVIPDDPSGAVHWPMSVAVLPQDDGHDLIVVLSSRIDRGDTDEFGFTYLGSTAALFRVARQGVPERIAVVDVTPDRRSLEQINWGAASTVSGRWLYAYGTRLTGEKYVFGRELYVGRAPIGDLQNRARWAFWDGSGWQPDHQKAAPILAADGGVSQTLSVHRVGDHFLAVSKRDGDLGDFVYTWTSPSPVGPWTPRQAVAAPFEVHDDELQYAPLAHPEVPLASGDLLVSISRNTTDLGRLFTDPELGRPRFVEVRLP